MQRASRVARGTQPSIYVSMYRATWYRRSSRKSPTWLGLGLGLGIGLGLELEIGLGLGFG